MIKRSERGIRAALWLAIALWCGFIFFMSSRTGEQSGGMSGRLSEHVAHAIHSVLLGGGGTAPHADFTASIHTVIRKCAHFFEYAVLGALMYIALSRHLRPAMPARICALALSTAYAASDEFHQLFVPGRGGQMRDVLIDAAGALTGIIIVWLIARIRRRRAAKT